MGPLYHPERVSDSVFRTPSPVRGPDFLLSKDSRLEEEVANLLLKGAVEKIDPVSPGFYSRIFIVLKKNGKSRLIIDLSPLNKYVCVQNFRMETQRKVRNAIYPNDWAFSLDLTDAYLHVPIHKQSRKFLRFSLNGQIFQFKALAFGLSTSPFVFTYLMNVIATFLRKRAIILHPYLDDWLARNQCRRTLLEHRHYLMSLITSLGSIINYEKSELVPTQTFTFIGMEFLTNLNLVRVPQDRIQKYSKPFWSFLRRHSYQPGLSCLFWDNSMRQQITLFWADSISDHYKRTCCHYGDLIYIHWTN